MFKNGCQGTVLIFAVERRFRSREAFSQWRGIFVAHFAAAKWERRLRNGTHVPKGAAKPPAKWVFGCENWSFKALGISQPISQLRNEGGLRNGTRVPRGDFAAAKIFVERGHGATKSFRSQWAFSQPRPNFTACFLWLRNYFATKGHFRKGFLWAAKSRRPWIFPCFWTFFYSKQPSFNFFAIPPKLDHSKRLSYI